MALRFRLSVLSPCFGLYSFLYVKGNVAISLDKEVNCRNLFISFDNVLTYQNPCVRDFSGWSIQNSQVFSGKGKGLCNAIIPVEFRVPENAPPSFSGRALNSRWLDI